MKFRVIHSFLLLGACFGLSAAVVPDAVTADPAHYTVEFENDVIRILRAKYAPGETSSMHSHDPYCAIFLRDSVQRMELPDGSVGERFSRESGDVDCVDAEVHIPTNVGDTISELILVEMKGRKAL